MKALYLLLTDGTPHSPIGKQQTEGEGNAGTENAAQGNGNAPTAPSTNVGNQNTAAAQGNDNAPTAPSTNVGNQNTAAAQGNGNAPAVVGTAKNAAQAAAKGGRMPDGNPVKNGAKTPAPNNVVVANNPGNNGAKTPAPNNAVVANNPGNNGAKTPAPNNAVVANNPGNNGAKTSAPNNAVVANNGAPNNAASAAQPNASGAAPLDKIDGLFKIAIFAKDDVETLIKEAEGPGWKEKLSEKFSKKKKENAGAAENAAATDEIRQGGFGDDFKVFGDYRIVIDVTDPDKLNTLLESESNSDQTANFKAFCEEPSVKAAIDNATTDTLDINMTPALIKLFKCPFLYQLEYKKGGGVPKNGRVTKKDQGKIISIDESHLKEINKYIRQCFVEELQILYTKNVTASSGGGRLFYYKKRYYKLRGSGKRGDSLHIVVKGQKVPFHLVKKWQQRNLAQKT
jgi:hypothetical protein